MFNVDQKMRQPSRKDVDDNDRRKITQTDLERAMDTIARVIELYGDAYWPIYDRLEQELTLMQTRTAKLAMHRARREKRLHGQQTAIA